VALLAAIAAVPIPLLMPLVVDEVLLDHPATLIALGNRLLPIEWQSGIGYLLLTLIITLLLRLAALILGVWQSREFALVAKDLVCDLRQQLLQRLARIALREYEGLGRGTITSRLVTDIQAIDDLIGAALAKALVALLGLVGVAIVLFTINWQLALVIIILNPLVISSSVLLGKRVKRLKAAENGAMERFTQRLGETLEGMVQLRASNRDRHYLQQAGNSAIEVRNAAASFAWRSDAASRLSFSLFLIGFECFRALSMAMVLTSDLSIGLMMAIFGYLWFMLTPVQDLLNLQYSYHAANAALARINQLITLPNEPHWTARADPFRPKTPLTIEISHLDFRYHASGNLTLSDINLTIAAGQQVALTGESGSGKSTLIQLLLGLYPAERGTIRYGGVPIEAIGLQRLREEVAVVMQHPFLFSDTLRANLTLGQAIDDAALWQALTMAQLADFVRQLPQQLDSLVGHQGVRLSGGQRQRLAIARMIVSNPSVVILDEATSALDAATEAALLAALRPFLAQRTTLIVAHRLSAVREADYAYLFDHGKIIEAGDHSRLIAANGHYARLYHQLQ
jgi:ATP-binding cassette, subfamily C, bacterial